MDYHELLVQNLDIIDRLVHFVARRHHLSSADTEEFASVVRFKLVDRDFAVLRKFQGRSSLGTYLTIVIERLCLDFCVEKWGRWRPSASARRMGAVAILLEQLMGRDELTFDEAVNTLQTNYALPVSRAELHAMLLQLPPRPPRRRQRETLEWTTLDGRTAAVMVTLPPEDSEAAQAAVDALAAALGRLTPDDRLILKLRFEDGLSVVQIAKMLGLEGKRLYRRLDRIMRTLRAELRRHDVDGSELSRLAGHPALSLAAALR